MDGRDVDAVSFDLVCTPVRQGQVPLGHNVSSFPSTLIRCRAIVASRALAEGLP
jgi:hypothetical protein